MIDDDSINVPPKQVDSKELTEEEAASVTGGMDVEINEVPSTVRTTDSGGLLSPGLMDRIVKSIVKGLKQ